MQAASMHYCFPVVAFSADGSRALPNDDLAFAPRTGGSGRRQPARYGLWSVEPFMDEGNKRVRTVLWVLAALSVFLGTLMHFFPGY